MNAYTAALRTAVTTASPVPHTKATGMITSK